MVKLALLFPGQGSQQLGMGRELAEAEPRCAQLFERANEVLGRDLRRLIFEGPEEELRQTRNTQPALYVANLAAHESMQAFLPPPMFLAGHSLGEYCALAVAGVFSFEDGLKLVQVRAHAMAEASTTRPGAMAAVLGLDDDKVAACCQLASEAGIVQPANYNAPGQVVISGDAPAVERASGLCRQVGAGKVVPLAVSGAFHCELMRPAGEKLRQAFADIIWSPARIPVVSNVDASPRQEVESIQQSLVEQLSAPVRWTQSMRRMRAEGAERFLELGPGRVLSSLMKRIDPAALCCSVGNGDSLQGGIAWLAS